MPAATLAGRPSRMAIRVAALMLTYVAFWVYRSTMLPGWIWETRRHFKPWAGRPS